LVREYLAFLAARMKAQNNHFLFHTPSACRWVVDLLASLATLLGKERHPRFLTHRTWLLLVDLLLLFVLPLFKFTFHAFVALF
jgi:hypothetical protein